VCHRAETALPPEPESVGRARQWAIDQLATLYRNHAQLSGDLALVVSELVTNSVRAAAGRVQIAIEAHHAGVTVAVTDDAAGVPVKRGPPPESPGGRGLLIVAALARQWGVAPERQGKTVWAELGVPDGARPAFNCTYTTAELCACR